MHKLLEAGGLALIDPRPPNYPLIDPKYPLLRAIRAPLKGHWGVLDYGIRVGFRIKD